MVAAFGGVIGGEVIVFNKVFMPLGGLRKMELFVSRFVFFNVSFCFHGIQVWLNGVRCCNEGWLSLRDPLDPAA